MSNRGIVMDSRKILGIVVIAVGVILLLFSNYIANQVAAGRMQISEGQRQVDTTESLFSVTPYTQPIGKTFTGSGQRRIDAGTAEANQYEALSNQLRIAGVILIVIGIGFFFFWKRRK